MGGGRLCQSMAQLRKARTMLSGWAAGMWADNGPHETTPTESTLRAQVVALGPRVTWTLREPSRC